MTRRRRDEPAVGVWSLRELLMEELIMTNKPTVTFNCTICGRSNPANEPHKCNLTERQRRKLEQDRRRQAAEEAAARAARCPDCAAPTPPGRVHVCPGPRDHARELAEQAQAASMIAALRKAGYVIKKPEDDPAS